MRTTVDLEPEAHRLAKIVAQSRGQSLGSYLSDLVLTGLGRRPEEIEVSELGFPVIHAGRKVTAEEVREYDKD